MPTNLLPINTEQADNLARFFIRSGGNFFLFGRPGIGKTDIGLNAATSSGMKTIYLNLTVVERPDLMGYPDLNNGGDYITYKSPYFLPSLKPGAKPSNVLILDEVDKAPQENTFPLLELLQSRTINGRKIDVQAVLLTGNEMKDRAGSKMLSSALLDRGAKYELQFDAEKWFKWAVEHDIHDLIIGFLKHNPSFICGDTHYAELASPSPRGWALASDAIVKARELKITDEETIVAIVSGFVGESVGKEFSLWYQYYRKYEPFALSLVEKGISPSEWKDWSPTERIVFVITAARVARTKFVEASKTKPKYGCIERLITFLEDVEPELQMLAISSFPLDMVVDTRYMLYKSAKFFEMSTKLSTTK
jgi:hypothetical protein